MNKNHFETILKNYHLHIPLLDFVQKLTASTKNCDISSLRQSWIISCAAQIQQVT